MSGRNIKLKLIPAGTLREDIEKLFSKYTNNELTTDEFWALRDITFSVNRGESVGLFGPNGSGKTTIIKLLSKVTMPTRGNVFVKGKIAPLISVGAGFHPELTGKENLYTNGTILGMSIKEIKEKEKEIMEFSGLESKFLNMPVKNYSSGMTARLGFAIAVHSNADTFLLDEILAVGDQAFREKCYLKINSLMGSNKTFLIVSHNLEQMQELTNKIIYMEKGQITKIV